MVASAKSETYERLSEEQSRLHLNSDRHRLCQTANEFALTTIKRRNWYPVFYFLERFNYEAISTSLYQDILLVGKHALHICANKGTSCS